jgi:hypothetical protein
MDRGDQMLAIGSLGLIIGPREGELSLNALWGLGAWILGTRASQNGGEPLARYDHIFLIEASNLSRIIPQAGKLE